MNLKIQQFVIIITFAFFASCRESPQTLSKISVEQVAIDSSLSEVAAIENFVAPYRKRVDQVLDSTLAYAPNILTKEDGFYNTSAGNLMARTLFLNPVREKTLILFF